MCALAWCVAACGSEPAPVDAGIDAGLMVPAGSCAQPGDVGNDIGVGTFCTPRGSECAAFPLAGVCLAQVAPDQGQWFCTRLCDGDDDCGMDAVCVGDARGMACVPARCAPPRPDAGPGGDAGSGGDAGGAEDAGHAQDATMDADARGGEG